MPPEPPTFFVDRCFGGKKFPGALTAHGWRVKRHDDFFAQDTADHIWIPDVGARGWIIFTSDKKIQFNPMEKEALKKSGTLTFILARKGHLKGPEMAAVFIKAEKAIFRAIKKHRSPAAFRVYDDGHIEKCRLD